MIRLSAFADEASPMLDGQIEALKRNEIEYLEIRGVNGENIANISCENAKKYADQLRTSGIKVWSIGSPVGKVNIDSDLEAHRAKLRHICELANIFGTDKVRMFSFFEAYGSREKVFSELSAMVEIAAEYGVELYHENEKAIYGDTLERVLDIMANVRGLKFVYDPANFLEVGEDSKKTLDALHSKTDYFHIKDVIAETHTLVPAGYGDGRIDELVARIGAGDDKVLTLEPHLKVFKGYSDIDATEMKNKFSYATNDGAFDAAAQALIKIILDQGYSKVEGGYEKQ